MKKTEVAARIDRRLVSLVFQREEQVVEELFEQQNIPAKRRLRLLPALVLLSLLLAGAALALGLSLSARFSVRQQAVVELGRSYGLTEETLGLFTLTIKQEGEGWIIRLVPKTEYPAQVGEYQVFMSTTGSPKASWSLDNSPGYQPSAGLDQPVWGQQQLAQFIQDKNDFYAKMAQVDWQNAQSWSLSQHAQVDQMLQEVLPYGEVAFGQETKVVPGKDDLTPEAALEKAMDILVEKYGVEKAWLSAMDSQLGFFYLKDEDSRAYRISFSPRDTAQRPGTNQSFWVELSSPQGIATKASWNTLDSSQRSLPKGDLANYRIAAEEYMAQGAFDWLSAREKGELARRLADAGFEDLLSGIDYLIPGAGQLAEAQALALAKKSLADSHGVGEDSLVLFLPSFSLQQQQGQARWVLNLLPQMYHVWGWDPKVPIGEYTATLDGTSGAVLATSWSLEAPYATTYTRSTWGQASTYPGYVLPWLMELGDKVQAILETTKDEHFLTIEEAARHDQLFRAAGFPEQHFLSALPRENDISQQTACDLALAALSSLYDLGPEITGSFDLVWATYLMHTAFQPFEHQEPLWMVSFHHAQGIWVVSLDAKTGDILDVNYDPAAAGNG